MPQGSTLLLSEMMGPFKAVLLGLALLLPSATGASIKSGAGSTFLAASNDEDYMPAAAIKRVIGMLENLIAEMDAEQAKDEEMFAEFSKWCVEQQEVTQQSIESLQATIEELSAALAKLYAQKEELEAIIAKLKEDIELTRRQIAQATEKRNEEHASFIAEQQDFDNSIKACAKAVEILAAHYGDGTVEEPERPDWMSLAQVSSTISRFANKRGMMLQPDMMAMLQQGQQQGEGAPRFQAKTSEALNIVDQMKELSDTFAADKQSAIDEENNLQKMYETLMKEKTELLNSLIKERDERQAVLNAVNQEIGEKETAKANAEAELEDEQKYLAAVKKSCEDTAILFEQRKKDRAEEKLATQEAIKVLSGSAGEALIQLGEKHQIHRGGHRGHRGRYRGRRHMRMQAPRCQQCRRAAALLSEAAQTLRSGTLATAAAATMGTDAVADVIQALNGLIDRLDADQKMETAHKDWCEAELAATQAKKEHHEATVEDLVQKIADEKATIVEKKQGIQDTIDSIARADHNFEEATKIRANEKEKFEEELQNYKDALDALNQAIDILSKFYASKGKFFIQEGVAPRAIAPGVFDSAYQMKGGSGIIQMIATVRKEYEQGKSDLEKAEAQAVIDFNNMKAEYQATRRDLVSQQDRLETELHTAEMNLSQFEEDKKANEDEIAASKVYLGQLGQSCDSLLKNYDKRVDLRKEEKEAIKKAIDVLENETF